LPLKKKAGQNCPHATTFPAKRIKTPFSPSFPVISA
jgi:hypothetical protein